MFFYCQGIRRPDHGLVAHSPDIEESGLGQKGGLVIVFRRVNGSRKQGWYSSRLPKPVPSGHFKEKLANSSKALLLLIPTIVNGYISFVLYKAIKGTQRNDNRRAGNLDKYVVGYKTAMLPDLLWELSAN